MFSSQSRMLYSQLLPIIAAAYCATLCTAVRSQTSMTVGSRARRAIDAEASTTLNSDSVTRPRDLFSEYMRKELFQCTSDYLQTIGKLNALIREAYESYGECQGQLKDASARKANQMDLLRQLFDQADTEGSERDASVLEVDDQASDGSAEKQENARNTLSRFRRVRSTHFAT